MTKIKNLMTRDVQTCHPDDSLSDACKLMWDYDCGITPVTEISSQRMLGIVTDRDAAIAACTLGLPMSAIPARIAMSQRVRACREDDDLAQVHATMRKHQIRRVPITNEHGELTGMLTLNDLAIHAHESGNKAERLEIAETLAAVSKHRRAGPVPATSPR